jgi:hypothetical protein
MFTTRPSPGLRSRGLLLLATLILGASTCVKAQGTPAPVKMTDKELTAAFTKADKDRDKSLSPFEARHLPVVSKAFAQYDGNSDGFMSFQEYMAAMKDRKNSAAGK